MTNELVKKLAIITCINIYRENGIDGIKQHFNKIKHNLSLKDDYEKQIAKILPNIDYLSELMTIRELSTADRNVLIEMMEEEIQVLKKIVAMKEEKNKEGE